MALSISIFFISLRLHNVIENSLRLHNIIESKN
nr:MAG TPA: hypothetical protein [Bacteriophage sp.]